jgi:CRISPR-associated endonuclease/helicase Cas3
MDDMEEAIVHPWFIGRKRPDQLTTPTCYLIQSSDQEGSLYIYGEYLLHQTLKKLPSQICLPHDIPRLVQEVYGAIELDEDIVEAKEKWDMKRQDKERRAENFCLHRPWLNTDMTMEGLLVSYVQDDGYDRRAKAAVKDTQDTIEVILICEKQGQYELIDGTKLPKDKLPDDDLAKLIAKHTLRLPQKCSHYAHLAELEKITNNKVRKWQESPWLSGELFQILDENGTALLDSYELQYTKKYGLAIKS